ncbi:unnamed protein product [Urochloa humidicola]
MSMLSSCTLLSMAPPAPAPALGKFSPATLQLRTKQPAASSLAVALPRAAPRYKLSRALRLVCHAEPLEYDILPYDLVRPSIGDQDHDSWMIKDKNNEITLKFKVGSGTEKKNMEVKTIKHQPLVVWLHIKYKGDGKDNSLATKLDVSLQMPPGYEHKNVTTAAILGDFLEIIITKPTKQENLPIEVTKKDENQSHAGTGETTLKK